MQNIGRVLILRSNKTPTAHALLLNEGSRGLASGQGSVCFAVSNICIPDTYLLFNLAK